MQLGQVDYGWGCMLIWMLEREGKFILNKYLYFIIAFLTILLKALFVSDRNSTGNFIICIQSCFNSKVFLNDLKLIKKNTAMHWSL